MTEKKTGWTPGPWTAGPSKYSDDVFIVQAAHPSNRVLARFDGDGDGPDDEEIASAHLIAAAPELYEALEAVNKLISEAALTGFNCHDGDWTERLFYSQQATSRTLRKARGEQS